MTDYSNDDQLAGALRRGDLLAQEAYFRRFQVPLIKFAVSKGFTFHDAEELAQEALAKGAEVIASFIPGTVMISWLCGIELNFMRRLWAERKEHPVAPLDEGAENAASLRFIDDLSPEEKQERGRLWADTQVNMTLADNQRYIDAVRLRYLGKMSYPEIEEALLLGKNIAKVYVQRGLKVLKRMHDATPPEDNPHG
jgi:DNA-directed RNA polymerase specialized sigma24 family protein